MYKKKRQEIYPTVSSHMVGLTVPLGRHKKMQHGAMAYHHVRIIVLLEIVGQIWRRTQI